MSQPVRRLLRWYDSNKRILPWNETSNPYHIWVSEIILQQTQVKQGLKYYERFLDRFPDVQTLASAKEESVLKMWEGLGYYSRARNLHKGAKFIVENHAGHIPKLREELLTVPGIGPYTSAAIAAFAFDQQEAAIDGNLIRVISRFKAYHGDVSKVKSKREIETLALELMGTAPPAEFNRALMDLGSKICRPTTPFCDSCPLQSHCVAFDKGLVKELPFTSKKIKKSEREFHYLLTQNTSHDLVVHRRNERDIWKGLYELPVLDPQYLPADVHLVETVNHTLTHQKLTIYFYTDQKNIDDQAVANALESFAFPVPIRNFLNQWTRLSG